jgi:hypothetical protein
MQRDLPSLQQELPLAGSDERHGISDQHQSLWALATDGNA